MIFCLLFLQSCISKGTDSLSTTQGIGSSTGGSSGSGGEATSLGFVVTALTPSAGSTTGQYTVTISGSQFTSDTTFTIGGTACVTLTIVSSSTAYCKIPAGTLGLKDVVATKGADTSTLTSGFRYLSPATVASVSPTTGPATSPTLVTITGANFIDGATVNVSHPTLALSACQPVTVVNSTTITCYTPSLSAAQSHAIEASGTLASFVVTNADNTQVTLANSFDFTPAPQYSSLSFGASGVTAPPVDGVLHSGLASYILTVNGSYFQAGLTVTVGGNSAGSCSYVSATQLTCTALPALGGGQANYNITITNTDGQSVSQSVLFVTKPTITAVSPTSARYTGGDDLTITGTGLGSSPTINIYNSANTTLIDACEVSTSSPLVCVTPNVTTAQNTTIRLSNSYNYHTTQAAYPFVENVSLALSTTAVGRVVQGSTATHTVTLSNTSTSVAATSVSIDHSALSAPFSFVSTTCGATIAALASCQIVLSYAPSGLAIQESADVVVSYNDGLGSRDTEFQLTGMGIELDVLVTSLDFGSIPFGVNHASASARFTEPVVVINRGNSAVTLNSGSFATGTQFGHTGGSFPGAGFTGHLCTGTLAARSKCLIALDFTPTSGGVKTDTYTFTYSTNKTKTIPLTGTGATATPTTCNSGVPYYDNGAGTVPDPWLLCSEAHFTQAITDTAANTTRDGISSRIGKFQMTADITLTSNLTGGITGFSSFAFNGGGYRIINPTINDPGVTRAIFISVANNSGNANAAILRNVQVHNSSVTAGSSSGTLLTSNDIVVSNSYAVGTVSAGTNSGGLAGITTYSTTMSDVYFIGSVTCSAANCGGLVGKDWPVTRGFSHGTVSGTTVVGGISGDAGTSTITDGASSATVTGTGANVGGIIGQMSANNTRSRFFGSVSGGSAVGGIVGGVTTVSVSQALFQGSAVASGASAGGIVGSTYANSSYTISISDSVSSGTVTAGSQAGGIMGYQTRTDQSTFVSDCFSNSMISTATRGGGIMSHTVGVARSVVRSYVASPFGTNLFDGSDATFAVIGAGINGATGGVFYLQNSGPDQTTSGVYDLTDGQMSSQAVFESSLGSWNFTTGSGKWKFGGGGYPYPILQWLPATWMP
jgi:hypothetical protein